MRTTFACVILGAFVTLTGCQTSPYRIPCLPEEGETGRKLAIGAITLSPPLLTPVVDSFSGDNLLNYGDQKKEENIAAAIQTANVGLASLSYDAASFAAAVNLAGTQIDNVDTVTRAVNTTGEVSDDPGVTPTATFSEGNEANHTKTRKSPETPESAPTPPTLAEGVQAAFNNVLSASGAKRTIPPGQVANLIASLKMQMINLEEYHNLAFLSKLTSARVETQWLPYRAHFSVTVEPGWYTYLKQYDAVIDIQFGPEFNPNADTRSWIRIVNVTPAEQAQTLDQLTAEISQLSTIASLQGTFQAVGLKAAYQRILAAAQRLEGLRKNTTHVVSFPKINEIRIRFRPNIVPTNEYSELQPTNLLFTATILVKNDKDKDKDNSLSHGEKSDTDQPLMSFSGAIEKMNTKGRKRSERKILTRESRFFSVSYSAQFEPSLRLKAAKYRWSNQGLHYEAPNEVEPPLSAKPDSIIPSLLPVWYRNEQKPFGFTELFGYYTASKGDTSKVDVKLAYSLSNPQPPDIIVKKLEWVVHGASGEDKRGEFDKVWQKSIVGVLQGLEKLSKPDKNAGDKLKLLVEVRRNVLTDFFDDYGYPKVESWIKEIVLLPRAAVVAKKPKGEKVKSTTTTEVIQKFEGDPAKKILPKTVTTKATTVSEKSKSPLKKTQDVTTEVSQSVVDKSDANKESTSATKTTTKRSEPIPVPKKEDDKKKES